MKMEDLLIDFMIQSYFLKLDKVLEEELELWQLEVHQQVHKFKHL